MNRRKILVLFVILLILFLPICVFFLWEFTEPLRYPSRPIHDAASISVYADANDVDQAIKELEAILKESPKEINARDKWGRTALHLTMKGEIAEFLLRNGADVNAKDNGGQTPLHAAADWGHDEVCAVLLSFGALVNPKDNAGFTPLQYALGHIDSRDSFPLDDEGMRKWKRDRDERRKKTIELLQEHGGEGWNQTSN